MNVQKAVGSTIGAIEKIGKLKKDFIGQEEREERKALERESTERISAINLEIAKQKTALERAKEKTEAARVQRERYKMLKEKQITKRSVEYGKEQRKTSE